ncbi:MAG TPA: hypothetical protein VHG10_02145 [Glycomyces sp.]|nr:hypothetical protein [Glycomyces sp.]
MSDSNLASRQSDIATSDDRDAKPRSRPVKPGHLEVGEFTSGHIGASSPFGTDSFPLPVRSIYYEHSGPVTTRILEDERH